jgi:hypothetical protein
MNANCQLLFNLTDEYGERERERERKRERERERERERYSPFKTNTVICTKGKKIT